MVSREGHEGCEGQNFTTDQQGINRLSGVILSGDLRLLRILGETEILFKSETEGLQLVHVERRALQHLLQLGQGLMHGGRIE